MINEPYRVVIVQDGQQIEESYQAIIGIKSEDGKVTLHIRENGDFDEEFWRSLPRLMVQSMGKGLAIRRENVQ